MTDPSGSIVALPPFAGLRCLVVDDEYLIALDIERVLETGGAETVVCVGRAAQALAAIESGPDFDLAVLDVKLDSGDSFMVANALTERGVPFIFLTGGSIDVGDLAPFHDVTVLTKPFDTATLSETLRAALATAPNKAKPGARPGFAEPTETP